MKVYVEYLDHHNSPIIHEYASMDELVARIASSEDVPEDEVRDVLEDCQSFEGIDTYNLMTPEVIEGRIRELQELQRKVRG